MEDQNGAINFMDDLTQSGVDTTSVFQIQMRLFKCMQWNLIIITFSDILNTFLLYFEQDVENLDEIKDAIVYYYISALTCKLFFLISCLFIYLIDYEFVQFKSSSIMIVCLNKILVDFKQEELFEKIFNHIFSLKILDEVRTFF